MSFEIKRNIAPFMAILIYILVAINAFTTEYIVIGLVAIGMAIGAFFKKEIFLDFISIILAILAFASFTLFFNYENADNVNLSVIVKILLVSFSVGLFLIYFYFLNIFKNKVINYKKTLLYGVILIFVLGVIYTIFFTFTVLI